jgi:hypothetical protein
VQVFHTRHLGAAAAWHACVLSSVFSSAQSCTLPCTRCRHRRGEHQESGRGGAGGARQGTEPKVQRQRRGPPGGEQRSVGAQGSPV